MAVTSGVSVSTRGYRPRTARESRLARRPQPGTRIVRWIGAAGRRRGRATLDPAASPTPTQEALTANVITLTWAQTFGQPAGPGTAG